MRARRFPSSCAATTSQYFHDSIETSFKGFGLSLDTFVNDHAHMHRDVLFFTADGGAPVVPQEPVGCDSEYRYWEGTHDFSAMNYSGVRVSYQHGRVSVFVDPRGTESWVPCFKDAAIAPPEGWWVESDGIFFGLSAKTGDLADNHDVLSFVVTLEDEPAPASNTVDVPAQVTAGELRRVALLFPPRLVRRPFPPSLCAVLDGRRGPGRRHHRRRGAGGRADGEAARRPAARARAPAHVRQGRPQGPRGGWEEEGGRRAGGGLHRAPLPPCCSQSALSKLQAQEEVNTERIASLEASLGDRVQGSLNERIAQLERQIGGTIRAQLDDHVLPTLHGRVDRSSTIAIASVCVLGAVVAVLFVFVRPLPLLLLTYMRPTLHLPSPPQAWRKYRYLKKSHLL